MRLLVYCCLWRLFGFSDCLLFNSVACIFWFLVVLSLLCCLLLLIYCLLVWQICVCVCDLILLSVFILGLISSYCCLLIVLLVYSLIWVLVVWLLYLFICWIFVSILGVCFLWITGGLCWMLCLVLSFAWLFSCVCCWCCGFVCCCWLFCLVLFVCYCLIIGLLIIALLIYLLLWYLGYFDLRNRLFVCFCDCSFCFGLNLIACYCWLVFMVVYVCCCFEWLLALWGCYNWIWLCCWLFDLGFLFLLVAAGLSLLRLCVCYFIMCLFVGFVAVVYYVRLAVCWVYCLYLIRLGVLLTAFAVFAFWICGIRYLCLLLLAVCDLFISFELFYLIVLIMAFCCDWVAVVLLVFEVTLLFV